MATYSDLQNRLVDLLDDTEVDAAKARQFISLCEPKLDRDLMDSANGGGVPRQKMARLNDQIGSDGTYALPSDYQVAHSVKVRGIPSGYASPESISSSQSGYGDADLEIDYYQNIPILSDSNTSNWMLYVGYDAYLYGAALQWISWGQDESNLGLWTTYYRDAIRTVKSVYKPQPRGGLNRRVSKGYGSFYTVIGETMYFGNAR